jgi:rubredoxin
MSIPVNDTPDPAVQDPLTPASDAPAPDAPAPDALASEATPEATPEAIAALAAAEAAASLAAQDRYECRSCGYTYEPEKGDDRRRVASGTAFKALPITWRCPVCGAPPAQFSNIGPKGKASGFEENLRYGLGVNSMTPGQKNILIFGSLGIAISIFISLYGLR